MGTFTPLTPDQVLADVRALMSGCWEAPDRCLQCSQVVHAVFTALAGPDENVLERIGECFDSGHVGSPDFHANILADSDWCDYDLNMVRVTVELGRAGVPYYLSWGPAHRTGVSHPPSWQECQSCRSWLDARLQARQMLAATGIDPALFFSDERKILSAFTLS